MIAFTFAGQPAAYGSGNYRSTRKATYQHALQQAFRAAYPALVLQSGDLSGIVLYFTKRRNDYVDPDADNISKPVWDSLTGHVYSDDRQIRLRTSGVVDLGRLSLTELSVETLPTAILTDLENFVLTDGLRHLLYIHVAPLRADQYHFQL